MRRSARNVVIRGLVDSGGSPAMAAELFGITRQRVDQITKPVRHRARAAAARAQKRGDLPQPDACESCGSNGDLEKHHPNYSRPLHVQWLCRECHARQHTSREPTANVAADELLRFVATVETVGDPFSGLLPVDDGERIREVPIACRYPEDRVHLLDAMTKRLGMRNRSEVIRKALDEMVERHFGRAA